MTRDRFISAVIIVVALCAIAVVATMDRQEKEAHVQTALSPSDAAEPAPAIPPQPPAPTYAGVVRRNMSFFDLMLACGLNPQQIKEIEKKAKPIYNFRRIYPNQRYEFYADSTGGLERLTFTIGEDGYIEVAQDSSGITAEHKTYPYETDIKTASGLITQSLWVTLQDLDVPLDLGGRLTDIYAWDIDFFRDIRKNDYFRVVYEEHTRIDNGAKRAGNIIAAEFNSQGEGHYAILFENEEGMPDYYDGEGRSLRKQLLRAPLTYSRISSSFSNRRLHPIHRRHMPHHGIDYAAPAGTPIMTTGDGTVMVAGYRRGNGNYVKIRHNSNYITYYLHLSRFGKGIKKGVKVKQGQVIGYVGSTGYATGPHLDYRVKKNGRFVNPRRLKLPPAKPITSDNMAAFLELKNKWVADLHQIPIKDSRTEHFASSAGIPLQIRDSAAVDDMFLSNPAAAH